MTGPSKGQGRLETSRKSELAQRIAQHIRSRRLTQVAAAGMLNIERAMVVQIMRGQCACVTEAQLVEIVGQLDPACAAL